MQTLRILLLLALSSLLISCAATVNRKVIVIAHRGASGYLPEHTLESTALAHSFNPDYIEPDVVLTKDNVPIILHDHHIDTTTNVAELYPKRKRADGRYYAIDFNLSEIKKLRVSERFNVKSRKAIYPGRFPEGLNFFQIPTLAEQLQLINGLNKSRDKNVGVYLEIKHPEFHKKNNKDILKETMKVLKQFGYTEEGSSIVIQCFDPKPLIELRDKYKSKIPRIQLIAENLWKESSVDYTRMQTKEGLAAVAEYAQGIGPWIPQVIKPDKKTSPLVSRAHELGLLVHPYTLRKDQLPEGMTFNQVLDLLVEVGVDGIFTDFPDLATQRLNK